MASKGTSKRTSSSLPVAAYVKVHQFGKVLLLCEFAVTRVLNAPADRGKRFCAEINGGEKMGLR